MPLTEAHLRAMMPHAGSRLDAHLPYIVPALEEGRIDTPRRIAAFMAQLAHESGEYRWMEEIADGAAYEGREDLGNTQPGDGMKFKGRGPIQITGRANTLAAGAALGIDDIEERPDKLTLPQYGTRSAVWFWNSRGLSLLADADWFPEITRRINGGYTHFAERVAYWLRNRELLGLPPPPPESRQPSRAQIRAFQAAHGLAADGIAGPKTIAALRVATGARP